MNENNYPKLHNATWPGIVGKGPDSEPIISFDTLLELTAAAEVDGIKFDGIDIGLFDPHINLDRTDDGIKKLADKVGALNLDIGSLVAPIWGGPAMGSKEERALFVEVPFAKSAALEKSYVNWVFALMESFVLILQAIRMAGCLIL